MPSRLVFCLALMVTSGFSAAAGQPVLKAAALEFAITPGTGGQTASKVGALVRKVEGPLKTTVTLLAAGKTRVCIIASHMNSPKGANISPLIRRTAAEALGAPLENVLLMVSHNHTDFNLVSNHIEAYSALSMKPEDIPAPKLLPAGEDFLKQLAATAKQLPALLQPATVSWAEGNEGRISYNRKGRRADGTSYLIREEDRDLLGVDFNGDMDRQAPIVVLKNARGGVVTAITHFTAHPCTCFHPERPIIFGDWPQVACDHMAEHFSPSKPIAVSFLQGCAGDVNSKGMFRGDADLSKKYGRMLTDSYIAALKDLKRSKRDGLDFATEKVRIPLAPLPAEDVLKAEIAEMEDFIRRATAGDENTLRCIGHNFPRELTPAYRGKLIEMILPWSQWALDLRQKGKADSVDKFLEVDIQVLRIGDVGIVGMPFEPFQGIGRQIRAGSPLPISIPCGYTNLSYGYLTDGANTNPADGEYMSAHYRYSKFRAPYAKPAGDVIAIKALETLRRFAQ
ncbi:MAG: hypothetical protein JNM65_09720 [Verrucomicrobiaceae bacterium]|nr:hypothetical protein [Verrucomicrobiaceae bacterium]